MPSSAEAVATIHAKAFERSVVVVVVWGCERSILLSMRMPSCAKAVVIINSKAFERSELGGSGGIPPGTLDFTPCYSSLREPPPP